MAHIAERPILIRAESHLLGSIHTVGAKLDASRPSVLSTFAIDVIIINDRPARAPPQLAAATAPISSATAS